MRNYCLRLRFFVLLFVIQNVCSGCFIFACKTYPQYDKKSLVLLKKKLSEETLKEKQRSVLKGLLWCVKFVQKNKRFNFIFSDYVTMLHELASNKNDSFVSDISSQLIKNAAARGSRKLKKIFPRSREGKWDFISVLPIFYLHGVNLEPYKRYYQKKLPRSNEPDYKQSLSKAVKKYNYDLLLDYVVDYSFINFAREVLPQGMFKLPKDKYAKVLKKCKKLPFVYKAEDEDGYHDQNYYATHIICALTRYGTQRQPKNVLAQRVEKYLKKNFYTVRHEVDDIDLLGEYIQCLKIHNLGRKKTVREAERYLVSKQLSNGSWKPPGNNDDYYDKFHPVWTSVVALNLV